MVCYLASLYYRKDRSGRRLSAFFFFVCTLVLYDGASVGAFNLGVVTASEMRSVPITARSANARKSVVHRTSLKLMLRKAFLPCLIDTYTSNRAASSGP